MSRLKVVYLSGPMTGYPCLNFPAFHAAAAWQREQGCRVVNPAEFDQGPDPTWENCMRRDLAELLRCESIVLLPGWQRSRGALLECYVAKQLGMPAKEYTELVGVTS